MNGNFWMDKNLISLAKQFFANQAYLALRSDDKRIAEEGLAIMTNAEPGYCLNLLSDHPDRIAARQWLCGYLKNND